MTTKCSTVTFVLAFLCAAVGGDAVADRGLAGDLLGVEDAFGVAVHADLDEHTALCTSVHGAAEGRRAGERAQALRTLIAVLTGFASVTSVALGAGITRRALVALITLLTVVALGSEHRRHRPHREVLHRHAGR